MWPIWEQWLVLATLALVVACVSWTVTHEEIFREPREFCNSRSKECSCWWQRKFFYVFTCEYCFSHYISAATLALADFRMIFDDWRGYIVSWFCMVAIANLYMALYSRIRIEIGTGRAQLREAEQATRKAG